MVFGGFAPFIATSLVAVTGLASSPSWYIVACALVSLSVLIWNRAASSSGRKRNDHAGVADTNRYAIGDEVARLVVRRPHRNGREWGCKDL